MERNSAFLIVILVLVIKYGDANSFTARNLTNILKDAVIAETVPHVSVSSNSDKDDAKGFASRKSFRDGGGYEELEVYGDKDKDKYGYATEVGFGKRSSNLDGKGPKVNDNHSYRRTTKLAGNNNNNNNNNWNDDKSKDIDIIMDDATTLRRKVEEKPKSASYTNPRSRQLNRNSNYNKKQVERKPKKEIEPSYEVLESVEQVKPAKSKKVAKKSAKSERLTDGYGPVLFDHEPTFFADEEKPAKKKTTKKNKKGSKKSSKKDKKGKKAKKAQGKSAKFTDIGGYDLSLENDGYGVFEDVTSAELDGTEYDNGNEGAVEAAAEGEAEGAAEGADYDTNKDYEESGHDYDAEEGEANENEGDDEGDYEEGGEKANEDYEEEEGEAAEGNDYEEDAQGEHSNGSDDFREHYIYASEADKDATYHR